MSNISNEQSAEAFFGGVISTYTRAQAIELIGQGGPLASTPLREALQQDNLPAGAAYMSPQILSYIVLYFNGFDYLFTQSKDDLFSVGYMDFEKRKGEKNGLVYGAVNYLDGELTTDKVDLATKADELRALPAKAGYVAVWEYYGKEKRMDIRLERVNL